MMATTTTENSAHSVTEQVDKMQTAELLNGLTWNEYREWPLPSQSDLKAVWDDAQLWHETHVLKSIAKPDDSHYHEWGRAVESALRDGFKESVTIIPVDVLTSNGARRGKAWDAYKEEHKDKTLVTEKEYLDRYFGLERAVENVDGHKYANALLRDGDPIWNARISWSADEFEMKGEADVVRLNSDILVDVKSSAANDPRSFERDVIKFGYDIQAAAYIEAFSTLQNNDVHGWRYFWVVVQNKAPWRVEVYDASEDLIEFGFERLRDRKDWFKQCRDSDVWRSPTHGEVVSLGVPAYARKGF